MTTIDDICIWKSMADDKESTTFQIVKKEVEEGKEHPLGQCLRCSGFEHSCKNYVMRHYYLY